MKVIRIVLLSLLVVGVVIFSGTSAQAAVGGTVHDIDAYTGPGGGSGTADTAMGGTCSYCHIPHGALGDRLWPSSPVVTGDAWKDTTVGNLCWSCHEGVTYTDAVADTPFDTSAHQRTILTLTGWGDIGTFPTDVRLDDSDSQLGCNSCHNPHDATFRPFQAWSTSADLSTACEKCHPNRFNDVPNLGVNNTGAYGAMHPTRQLVADNATMNFLASIDVAFTVNGPTGSADVNVRGWNLGGHLSDHSANLGTGEVSCMTCHAVHGNEGTGAGLIPNNLLAVENEGGTTAALCQGCHEANPGTGAGTHPVNTAETAPGQWPLLDITKPAGWPFGDDGGGNDVLICSTCHQMHYARDASSLYRGDQTDSNNKGTFCGECHVSSATTWNHHPSGMAVTAGTDIRDDGQAALEGPIISTADADIVWPNGSGDAGTINPAGSARYGLATGNVVHCGTCHASGAHNEATFPGVVGKADEAEMCVDCHSFNPSTYTQTETTHTMSHYVGTVQTAAYRRGTVSNPGAFTNSNLTPRYANEQGSADDTIICISCHELRSTGTTGGNVQVSNNAGAVGGGGMSYVTPGVSLMIEESGNAIETSYANAANYLCTGCHGATPGGGATHPIVTAQTSPLANASAAVITRVQTVQGDDGATLTSVTGTVNCESCHRAHDAANNSGALILEGVGAGSDKALFSLSTSSGAGHYANQAGLCTQCHDR